MTVPTASRAVTSRPRSPQRNVQSSHALRRSFLDEVEPRVVDALLSRSVVQHVRSGEVIVSETDGQWTGILLSGMVRIFLRTPGGRQVTLRHAKPGGTIGIAALLGKGAISAQAITDCEVLRLDNQQVVMLAGTRPDLAMAIARELSVRLIETYAEIVIRDQGSVHQRLARQLLHLSSVSDSKSPLAVLVSHSEIADAVGSAREVVTRHLHRFQTDGMLRLERGRITILDPHRLHEAASDAD
jgi:CRP/FNR family cyclic AMP-dependent transcriptional regulator